MRIYIVVLVSHYDFGKESSAYFIVAYMFPETVNWLASADEYVPLTLYSFRVLIPSIGSYMLALVARFDRSDLSHNLLVEWAQKWISAHRRPSTTL